MCWGKANSQLGADANKSKVFCGESSSKELGWGSSRYLANLIQLNSSKESSNKEGADQATDDKTVDNEPINDKAVDNEPINDKAVDNELINDKAVDNEPINGKAVDVN